MTQPVARDDGFPRGAGPGLEFAGSQDAAAALQPVAVEVVTVVVPPSRLPGAAAPVGLAREMGVRQ